MAGAVPLQDLAGTQKGQLNQHTKASDSLFGSIRVMESKLSEAKSKKDTLKVRRWTICIAACVVETWLNVLPHAVPASFVSPSVHKQRNQPTFHKRLSLCASHDDELRAHLTQR